MLRGGFKRFVFFGPQAICISLRVILREDLCHGSFALVMQVAQAEKDIDFVVKNKKRAQSEVSVACKNPCSAIRG